MMTNVRQPKYTPFSMMLSALAGLILGISACRSPQTPPPTPPDGPRTDSFRVQVGAEVMLQEKMFLLKGKRVGIVANPTSLVGSTHLVDTLLSVGVQVKKVFAPEHGFRGDQDAGAAIASTTDPKTGLPLISLYGDTKKPTPSMLADLDVVLFDIQDVGARFYTYISTLHYVMEACAENGKQIIVLDRPNPNGWYVDGPVLEPGLHSFVGMHPVPVVHGMTIGEYAQMINSEGWLAGKKRSVLTVVACKNYHHGMKWADTGLPWVAPSPNLGSPYSAYLYPILCWFEGTPVSVGRGTDQPFQILGAPWHKGYHDRIMADSIDQMPSPSRVKLEGLEMEYLRFIPKSIPGKATQPLFENQFCYGVHFLNEVNGKQTWLAGLHLLKNFYDEFKLVKQPGSFFQAFFDKLAGTVTLKNQISLGKIPDEIYQSWRGPIGDFQAKRRSYLLYPDFPAP